MDEDMKEFERVKARIMYLNGIADHIIEELMIQIGNYQEVAYVTSKMMRQMCYRYAEPKILASRHIDEMTSEFLGVKQ